jgi:hypothetical protein
MALWSVLRPFDFFMAIWYSFGSIWYIFPHFGILYHEKSGNPAAYVKFKAALSGNFYGHLVYFGSFGIFWVRLVHFGFVWFIFSYFGILCEEKSGNTV